MTIKRFLRSLKSFSRIKEILICMQLSGDGMRQTLAYLQLIKLHYPYVFTTPGGHKVMLNDWADLTTAWVVYWGAEYRLHEKDKVIIDAGANIGLFSLFAKEHAPGSTIYAIEPFPANYERLKKCIAENTLNESVNSLNCALSSVDGELHMDASAEIPGHSRQIVEHNQAANLSSQVITVPALSLGRILAQHNIEKVDFLKIDIEGGEYDLLLNTETAVLKKCSRIGLEYHGNGDTNLIFDRLISIGFRLTYHPKRGSAGVVEFTQYGG